ncbi:MAG: DUF512 domain-containing protein [Synechococcaceae cyanobacterium SM2_3_60]|nr:DUF512 domain-containing protein [Synechococcaceae cyanobacterium SM2_3_60]
MHAQVVVCPDWNDGLHLERTLRDLAEFYPELPPLPDSLDWGYDLEDDAGADTFDALDDADFSAGVRARSAGAAAVGATVRAAELDEALDESFGAIYADADLADADLADADLTADTLATVASVAVVPVGLTRFRPPDDVLEPVSQALAIATIAQVEALQAEFRQRLGTTFAWLADEWYLIAEQPLPPIEHYEDYPQLANGVGSIRRFLQDFEAVAPQLPSQLQRPQRLAWIVGNAVELAFQPIVERLNQIEGLSVTLIAIASAYWGQTMTVTGLVTGQDILAQFQPVGYDAVLLPSLMLKDNAVFLDDLPLDTLQAQLKLPIQIVAGGAADLVTIIQALAR